MAAWIPCPHCDGYLCTIHGLYKPLVRGMCKTCYNRWLDSRPKTEK